MVAISSGGVLRQGEGGEEVRDEELEEEESAYGESSSGEIGVIMLVWMGTGMGAGPEGTALILFAVLGPSGLVSISSVPFPK